MSKARFSIIVYSTYLAIAGLALAFVPQLILPLVGLAPSGNVFIRLCGSLALALAIKGIENSRYEEVAMFRLDVYMRLFVATFLLVLVLLHIAPPIFLVLSALDYGGALWTQLAIRSDKRQPKYVR